MCQSEKPILQNRATRLITFVDLNVRTSTFLGDLGWECLEQRRSRQLATVLFKYLHNLAPIYLNKILKPTSSIHS